MTNGKLNDYEPTTYHGLPVLELHVGDPIPTPRAPTRYAVHVGPALARYLLTFNPTSNRVHKPRRIRAMASDMAAERWIISPQSVCFGDRPELQNGQNTLEAVIESGVPVWLLVDFGWPAETVYAFDHNTVRTNSDTLHIAETPQSVVVASLFALAWRYRRLVGTETSFDGADVPSAPEALAYARANPEALAAATKAAAKLYLALDKGASKAVWGAAYLLIAEAHPEWVDGFFDQVAEGTGEPRSATRALGDWFRRRPAAVTSTKTGDRREPLEIVVRAFNAWSVGKSMAFPKQSGFTLSRIK